MKRPFKISDFRFPIERRLARLAAANRQSPIANRKSEDGVALVITLIMLSVITFMAVTFLVLSQRERNSVQIATDQKIARMAADTSFERVMAELTTRMLLKTNFQDSVLIVSTNYINRAGFHDGLAVLYPTNVNYDYEVGTNAYTGGAIELQRKIASLLYNPRARFPSSQTTAPAKGNSASTWTLTGMAVLTRTVTGPVISPFAATPYYNATNVTLLEPVDLMAHRQQ
jgi:hypothetical protein